MGSVFGNGGQGTSGALDPLQILPEGAFSQGGPETFSTISSGQNDLLTLLADFSRGTFGDSSRFAGLMDQLFRDTSPESYAMSERVFRDALLGPAMNEFNTNVAPKIAGDFANAGATLSSRRGQTLARERTNVVRTAESGLAGLLPQIQAFPLQQTLAQIQGFQQPYQTAAGLATAGTQQTLNTPPGPAWGTLNSFVGAF